VLGLDGFYRVLDTERWAGGVLASYRASLHADQREFDTLYPSLGVWLDRQLDDNTIARFRYDFGYAWIDYDPFLGTHRSSLSLIHSWADAGVTELFFGSRYQDFRFDRIEIPDAAPGPVATCIAPVVFCGEAGLREDRYRDRDGRGVNAGVVHRVSLGFADAVARAGYRYERYWANGDEWDQDRHLFTAGLAASLLREFEVDVSGSYSYEPHQHFSSYPHPADIRTFSSRVPPEAAPLSRGTDREDHVFSAGVVLDRRITEHLSLSVSYSYLHSNSNSKQFDYDRHIVGTYLTVNLP
jgi:hypothetical protein